MNPLEALCVLLWNVTLILLMLPTSYLIALMAPVVSGCLCGGAKEAVSTCWARAVIRTTCLVWRLAIALCCWIRVDAEGLDEFRSQLGSSGRPCIILANHCSFLDTILAVSLMPVGTVGQVKMLIAQRIMEMPLLGTIAIRMGHIKMPPKEKLTPEEYCQEIERSMQELEAVVAKGGIAAWFPEGRMNLGDPLRIEPFKAGGLLMATRHDVEVWCMASVGQSVCWPRKSALGGRPCRIGVKVFRLCESSHKIIAGLGHSTATDNNPTTTGSERAASVALAQLAHDAVQDAVDEIVASGRASCSRPSPKDSSQPLLA